MRAWVGLYSSASGSTQTITLSDFQQIAQAQAKLVEQLAKYVEKDAKGHFVRANLPPEFINALQPREAAGIFSFLDAVQMAAKVLKGEMPPPTPVGYGGSQIVPLKRLKVKGAANVALSATIPVSGADQAANELAAEQERYCAQFLTQAQADLQTIQSQLSAAQTYMTQGDAYLNQAQATFNASNYALCASDAQQAQFYFQLVDTCNELISSAQADLSTLESEAAQGLFGISCGNQTAITALANQARNAIVNQGQWTGEVEQNAQQLIQAAQQQSAEQQQQVTTLTSQIQQCVKVEVQWWGEVDFVFDEDCTRALEQVLLLMSGNSNIKWAEAIFGGILAGVGVASWAAAIAIAGVALECALIEQDVWLADRANHKGVTFHFSFAPWFLQAYITLSPWTVIIEDLPTLLAELASPGFGNWALSIFWITGN